MCDAGFDKFELYRANAAIIHVRWCNAMGTCFGISHGNVADPVDGEAVVQATIVVQDAAMAVRSVFAEADVCDDEEGREPSAEKTDGLNDRTLWVIGCGAERIFGVGRYRDTEENDGAETFPHEWLEVGDEFVDPAAVLIGKGRNESFFFALV